MKLSVTVNLGNYENIKIESSEYISIDTCRVEVVQALVKFAGEPKVKDFIERYF